MASRQLKEPNKWREGWKILENLIAGWGVEEILFDKLKSITKKLKCFRLLPLFKSNTFLNQMHYFRY